MSHSVTPLKWIQKFGGERHLFDAVFVFDLTKVQEGGIDLHTLVAQKICPRRQTFEHLGIALVTKS